MLFQSKKLGMIPCRSFHKHFVMCLIRTLQSFCSFNSNPSLTFPAREQLTQLISNLNRQKKQIKESGIVVDGKKYLISFTGSTIIWTWTNMQVLEKLEKGMQFYNIIFQFWKVIECSFLGQKVLETVLMVQNR